MTPWSDDPEEWARQFDHRFNESMRRRRALPRVPDDKWAAMATEGNESVAKTKAVLARRPKAPVPDNALHASILLGQLRRELAEFQVRADCLVRAVHICVTQELQLEMGTVGRLIDELWRQERPTSA